MSRGDVILTSNYDVVTKHGPSEDDNTKNITTSRKVKDSGITWTPVGLQVKKGTEQRRSQHHKKQSTSVGRH